MYSPNTSCPFSYKSKGCIMLFDITQLDFKRSYKLLGGFKSEVQHPWIQ